VIAEFLVFLSFSLTPHSHKPEPLLIIFGTKYSEKFCLLLNHTQKGRHPRPIYILIRVICIKDGMLHHIKILVQQTSAIIRASNDNSKSPVSWSDCSAMMKTAHCSC